MNYLEGRLNQGNAKAANNATNWSGTCYITPLIGAFIADAYLGRYWTIAIFVFIYVSVSFFFHFFSLDNYQDSFNSVDLRFVFPFSVSGYDSFDVISLGSWT